jgi:hypothetical protein
MGSIWRKKRAFLIAIATANTRGDLVTTVVVGSRFGTTLR